MSTFVVTIFPTESKAYEGVHALDQLHDEASITLYSTVVVQRQPDGTLAVKQRTPTEAIAGGVGALLGAMIGVFGGPAGVLAGAMAGTALGGSAGIVHADVSDEFLEDISKHMNAGDFAVLAEVSEKWTAPIDTRMRELGAIVLREKRSDVIDGLMEKRAEEHRAAVEERKAERAAHKAERMQAKLESSLVEARERLQRVADKAQHRLDDTKAELQQKLAALDEQAQKATPEVKTQIEQRIAEIRRDFSDRQRKLTHAFEIAQQALQ